MANEQNLKPFSERPAREVRELAKKGNKASTEAKRARKTLKESLLLMLADDTIQDNITVALIKEAMNRKPFGKCH